jgi:SAM-dependent methyltransferase
VARRHPRLEVEGIEMAPDKVAAGQAAGRQLKLDNLRIDVGDITRIDRPGRYDLAVSVDVLEHVPDDQAALKALAECLRPSGLLILHVPRAAPRRFFAVLDEHHQEDHVRDGYEPKALAGQMRAAGFAEVEIRHTFGAAGELAWEIMQLARRGQPSRTRELAAVILSPLLLLLCELDVRLGAGEEGNGLLVLARRLPEAEARGTRIG